MVRVINLNAEVAQLRMLEGRTPTTNAAARRECFSSLLPYRDGAVFAAKFSGKSAWERHPQGDEIVQIVSGETTLRLITAEGRETLALTAGMVVVVPKNTWHQFEAPDGVAVMTATPQPTEHLYADVDDPRAVGTTARGESR
jgi:mannose-6-phosphate isomerase-like protein (cupin superfamily)